MNGNTVAMIYSNNKIIPNFNFHDKYLRNNKGETV